MGARPAMLVEEAREEAAILPTGTALCGQGGVAWRRAALPCPALSSFLPLDGQWQLSLALSSLRQIRCFGGLGPWVLVAGAGYHLCWWGPCLTAPPKQCTGC